MKRNAVLLLMATCTTSLLSSDAQQHLANVIGYVNVPVTNGYTMIANQLDLDGTGTNNTIATVLGTNLPSRLTVEVWNGTAFQSTKWNGTTWTANDTLITNSMQPGSGFFVDSPTETNVIEAGIVLQGTNVYPVTAAYQVVSPNVPLNGGIDTTFGYIPAEGDQVVTWNGTGYFTNEYNGGSWSEGEPIFSVGQSAFLVAATNKGWTQTFKIEGVSAGFPPVCLTNWVVTQTNDGSIVAAFNIAGGTRLVGYDIYTTTNLSENSVYPQWTWLGQGYTAGSYIFTNQSSSQAFYAVTLPQQTEVIAWGDNSSGQCNVPLGLTNVIEVAGGYNFSLALKSVGTVVAWGDDTYEETNVPLGLTNVLSIAAGGDFALALLQNGTVKAWGGDEAGQTDVPVGLTNVIAVAAGDACSMALLENGTVVAWGYNYYGQTNVPALGPVSQIAAGVVQGVALLTNSTAAQWGNFNGSPYGWTTEPSGLSNVVSIAAGACHTLALQADGSVIAWGAGESDSGYNNDGQSIVPTGLSNAVAVAGGYLFSVALESAGTVVAWGDDYYGETDVPDRLTGVKAISAGGFHTLAIRSGPFTPLITEEPENQYAPAGRTVTFISSGEATGGVRYQWQFNGIDIAGATNATLSLINASAANDGSYQVIVSDNAGSVTSDVATFTLVLPPEIVSNSPATPSTNWICTNLVLSASATDADLSGFPLTFQWQLNGTNIPGATGQSYSVNVIGINGRDGLPMYIYNPDLEGNYTLTISDAAGSTNVMWNVRLALPGMVVAWGDDTYGECDPPPTLTNTISISAGEFHSLAVTDGGFLVQWGYNWGDPPVITNAVAVAAGYSHSLALLNNGNVVAWGGNNYNQCSVPALVTDAIAVAAGGQQSLALLQNGTVIQWGQTNAPIPVGLTNVTAIACGTNFCLALLTNATVVAWGDNTYGQTRVPTNLTNVVAVAAGGTHALALLQNGSVVGWGNNASGETNIPTYVTNAMAIAAGDAHSVALLNNGTVVDWGDNTYWQLNVISNLPQVKLIAAGGNHTLASLFSPTVEYPIKVKNDLLLIYNTNSFDSRTVLNYYLQNRPLVEDANVLGIGSPGIFITNYNSSYTNYSDNYTPISDTEVYETITYNEFTNQVLPQVHAWLDDNPTKRPQYVVLFLDVPSRIFNNATNAVNFPFYPTSSTETTYASISVLLATSFIGWSPFITHINMNGTNDCIAYIKKLSSFGSTYSPGKLIISASAAGYGNTNYYFDNSENLGSIPGNVSGLDASNAVVEAGASPAVIIYTNVPGDPDDPTGPGPANQIDYGTNFSGYLCFGAHSNLGGNYATNGLVNWAGQSDWWLIETVESFNGQRYYWAQGNITEWFSYNAFGGNNYSDTPVGAVSHTDEPDEGGVEDASVYFGLWQAGKNFGICAWNSRVTVTFQAVGDPFVVR